jgi:predicted aldo/keto reductase-like oxidoreductase
MDTEEQAGIKGVQLAESLGVPLVIMEPVKGGSLANLPEDVTTEFKRLAPDASTASWALRFVGSFDNIKVILSGMSTEEQVDDNLKTFNNFKKLSDEEMKAVTDTADALRRRVFNGCTGCRYCMPCPNGVDIPRNFRIWNTYGMYQNAGHTKWEWSTVQDDQKAKNCIQCGMCETQCPQHLNIRDDLSRLQGMMDELK